MSSIRDEIERSTEGLPLLGYSVQWSMRGVQVQHNELVKALAGCGFGRYTPDPPTPRKALRRAIESWVMARSRAGHGPTLSWRYSSEDEESAAHDQGQGQGQSRRQQMLVRTINQRDSEYLVFALVLEEADLQALGLTYGTDLRVLLRKSDLTIAITAAPTGRVNDGPTPPVAAELPDHWARYRNLHMAADLSRTVCQIVRDMGAISLRAGGGTYFVPPSAVESLGRLRALLNKLEELSATKDGSARAGAPTGGTDSSSEGSSFLLALGVPDAQAAKRSLARAAHTSFMDELAVLHTDLQRFTSAPAGTVKEKTVRDRLLQYKEMHARAEMYAALLEMQNDQITDSLIQLEAQALAVIMAAPHHTGEAEDDATSKRGEERTTEEGVSTLNDNQNQLHVRTGA